jgi:DNA-binding NtrC family response regulator
MSKYKILLIDDDLDLSAAMKLTLETNNYDVITAVNTTGGMELIKNLKPDLIILDIIMDTDLEGFNFLNLLKVEVGIKEIPVIINTSMAKAIGVNLRWAIEDVEHLPWTKFVEKSDDCKELLSVVKEYLH